MVSGAWQGTGAWRAVGGCWLPGTTEHCPCSPEEGLSEGLWHLGTLPPLAARVGPDLPAAALVTALRVRLLQELEVGLGQGREAKGYSGGGQRVAPWALPLHRDLRPSPSCQGLSDSRSCPSLPTSHVAWAAR